MFHALAMSGFDAHVFRLAMPQCPTVDSFLMRWRWRWYMLGTPSGPGRARIAAVGPPILDKPETRVIAGHPEDAFTNRAEHAA